MSLEQYLNNLIGQFDEIPQFIQRTYDKYPSKFTYKRPVYIVGAPLEKWHNEVTETYETLEQAIDSHYRLVILGSNGAGKTSELQRIAVRLAKAHLGEVDTWLSELYPNEKPIPIWINLGGMQNFDDVEHHIQKLWESFKLAEENYKNPLRNGHLWLFLDGLNEMPDPHDIKRNYLDEWAQSYDKLRILISCRLEEYNLFSYGYFLQKKYIILQLRSLTSEQINEILETVHKEVHLKPEMPFHLMNLRKFSQQTDKLPETLSQLYQVITPLPELRAQFSKLAFEMLAKYKGTYVERAWVVEQIGQATLSTALEEGVLMEVEDKIGFSHLILRNHFAIPKLINALSVKWIDIGMGIVSLILTVITLPITYPIYAIGIGRIFGQFGSIKASISPTSNWGAWDFTERNRAVTEIAKTDTLAVPELLKAIQKKRWSGRGLAAKALGHLGAVEAIPHLLTLLNDKESWARADAATALGLLETEAVEAVPQLIKKLDDNSWRVVVAATEALGSIQSSDAVKVLSDKLQNSDDRLIRMSAASALGQIGDIKAQSALQHALNDPYALIQITAQDSLSKLRRK